jgi:hypothetical protein
MTKRKIENSETSKYENKQFLKFTRRNTHIPLSPLAKLHTICFLKTHKMTRKKVENFKIVKQKTLKIHKS